jgi:tetratricopeptide (TPR) repeat protein
MFFRRYFRKTRKDSDNFTQGYMHTLPRNIYMKLNNSLALAATQQKENAHEKAISSGMKIYKRGEKIADKYEVFSSIRGGMGLVYLCYDHLQKEPVAVKTMLPEYFKQGESSVENFKKEALTWVNLEKHYNIVNAKHVWTIDNMPYIVMEMIIGDENYGNDLSCYLGRYQFNMEDALKLAVQFSEGMIYAEKKLNEMGKIFIHRDIKPANIMVTRDKVPKITDFGIVKTEAEDKQWGGTYGYMSPEQFEGKVIDARADIYSFGCVLYEIFCNGRRPHELSEEEMVNMNASGMGMALQYKHLSEKAIDPFPFIPENKVKREISNMILKCLDKDKDKRFRNFGELREQAEELFITLSGKLIPAKKSEELNAFEMSNKGVSFGNLGKYNEALECFDRALDINPKYAKALLDKAIGLLIMERAKEALECSDKALEIDPEYNIAWCTKGMSLRRLNKLEESIACFDKHLKVDPEYIMASSEKGMALLELGRFREAIHCFDKVLMLEPEKEEACYRKGLCLANLGECKEAIAIFDRILKINPESAPAWCGRGLSLNVLGKHEESIECYDKALASDPNLSEAFVAKGMILNMLKRHEAAIDCYDKSIALNPQFENAWHNKGEALFDMKLFQKAIVCFEKALNINPNNTSSWYKKGDACVNVNLIDEAIECYDRVLALDPAHSSAWNNKGTALDRKDRFEDAVACFAKSLELDPENANTWYSKGVNLLKLGRTEEALECSEKVLGINDQHAGAWYFKGLGIFRIGQTEEGIRCIKKASELGLPEAMMILKKLGT